MRLSMDMGCFYFMAPVNNTAVNMSVQIPENLAFNAFGYMPGSGIVGSFNNCI